MSEIDENEIEETIPLHKFLNGTTEHLAQLKHDAYPEYLDSILAEDMSQRMPSMQP